MSYIYDIVLNFNMVYYDFFEWQEGDKIKNINKIALFRVNDSDYLNFKFDDIMVDDKFLEVVKNCNNIDSNNSNNYYFLISNGREVMGISIDDKGYLNGRSSLLFDEEDEVICEVEDLREYVINYKIIGCIKDKNIVSRVIKKKKSYLLDFFNRNNEIDIYRYIYYDFYEEEEVDIRKIKEKLLGVLDNNWDYECEKLYNCVKLLNRVR